GVTPAEAQQLAEEAGAVSRVLLRFVEGKDESTVGAETRVPSGTTLFDAASWNGIAIDSTCGGHGTCKKCKVRVVSGSVPVGSIDPRAFKVDELKEGWRLACRAEAHEDLVVYVPPLQTRPKAALAGVGRHVILRPAVQKRYLELDEPTLEDQASDVERVLAAMDDLELRVSLEVARPLGRTLRGHAHATLDELTAEVCEHAGVAREEVYEIVVTGNVTMMQIALGIDPEPLSMAPFIITARKLPPARAADFGVLVHPRAPAV